MTDEQHDDCAEAFERVIDVAEELEAEGISPAAIAAALLMVAIGKGHVRHAVEALGGVAICELREARRSNGGSAYSSRLFDIVERRGANPRAVENRLQVRGSPQVIRRCATRLQYSKS